MFLRSACLVNYGTNARLREKEQRARIFDVRWLPPAAARALSPERPSHTMGNARAPYSVAKANRDEKVRRWKAIGKFKKQQKREEREAAAGNKPVNAIPLPAQVPEQLRAKKKPKAGADATARTSALEAAWQKRQRVEAAEAEQRADVQRQAADRRRELAEAQRKRKEQTAKLNKRTKRGQPILSNQVERMLAKIQAP